MSWTFVFPLGLLGPLSPSSAAGRREGIASDPPGLLSLHCVLLEQDATLHLWAVFGKNLRSND